MQKTTAGKFHGLLPALSRVARSDAQTIKLRRPADGSLLPIAMIGIRHVPLAARVKCYIRIARGRKGHAELFVAAHESGDGPSATSRGDPPESALRGEPDRLLTLSSSHFDAKWTLANLLSWGMADA